MENGMLKNNCVNVIIRLQVFTHENDICYFSHCYPYTFSYLLKFIDTLQENEKTRKYIQKEVKSLQRFVIFKIYQTLCHTLAGNPCPLVTITDFDSKFYQYQLVQLTTINCS